MYLGITFAFCICRNSEDKKTTMKVKSHIMLIGTDACHTTSVYLYAAALINGHYDVYSTGHVSRYNELSRNFGHIFNFGIRTRETLTFMFWIREFSIQAGVKSYMSMNPQ